MHLEVGTVLVGSLESQAAHLLKVPKTLRVSGTFSMGLALRLPQFPAAAGEAWGQYPPALSKLIAKRKNFAQLEDSSFACPL